MDGRLLIDILFDLFGFLFLPRCHHETWHNGIDGGTRILEFLHQVLHQRMNGRLCDAISQHCGMGMKPHLRTSEQDARTSRYEREQLADKDIMGVDRHLHHLIPVVVGRFRKRLPNGQSGIAHDAIHRLELFFHLIDEAVNLFTRGLVDLDGNEIIHFFREVRSHIRRHHTIALVEQHFHHSEANARSSSCNNSVLHYFLFRLLFILTFPFCGRARRHRPYPKHSTLNPKPSIKSP